MLLEEQWKNIWPLAVLFFVPILLPKLLDHFEADVLQYEFQLPLMEMSLKFCR